MDVHIKLLVVLALAGTASASVQFYEGAVEGFYFCRDPFTCVIVPPTVPATPLMVNPYNDQLVFYNGATQGLYFCRDPFLCNNYQDYGTGCGLRVDITWPTNGSTFYWSMPSVNEDVNWTVTGTEQPDTCEYKINSGSWNLVACSLGNNTAGTITQPEGYPNTLYVRVNNSCGSVVDYIQYNVVYKPGGVTTGGGFLEAAGATFLVSVFLVFAFRRRGTNAPSP